jgi:hypothetical protein
MMHRESDDEGCSGVAAADADVLSAVVDVAAAEVARAVFEAVDADGDDDDDVVAGIASDADADATKVVGVTAVPTEVAVVLGGGVGERLITAGAVAATMADTASASPR